MMDLINDVLDMNRIETGTMTLHNEEFSLREMLDLLDLLAVLILKWKRILAVVLIGAILGFGLAQLKGNGSDDTESLYLILDLTLTSKSGSIYKYILPAIMFYPGINGIPGSSCYI